MTSAISVNRLSKLYRVGARQHGYRTLREAISDACAAPWRRVWRSKSAVPEASGSRMHDGKFWALKDVSFEVRRGEVVGIIGRNGAGKSTLLKILSRITEPTSGRVELRGRVGSLLEVGTGFHPELTGRENIYMNGSILGMSRREITRKFDEIVAFAEVDDFLDTPVKRYSSGMSVRLAFAVAAHLEPEILIIDEVLAVGDAAFQRRCLDRMKYLARSGATVLLVSHQLETIPQLCEHAVLLEGGRVRNSGRTTSMIDDYISSHLGEQADDLSAEARYGDGRARFIRMKLLDSNRHLIHGHVSGSDLIVSMEIDAYEDIQNVAFAVVLSNLRGTRLVTSWTKEAGVRVDLKRGSHIIDCRFANVRFRPGHQFTVSLWMATQTVVDALDDIQTVQVLASENDCQFSTSTDQGILLCDHTWQHHAV